MDTTEYKLNHNLVEICCKTYSNCARKYRSNYLTVSDAMSKDCHEKQLLHQAEFILYKGKIHALGSRSVS